MGQEGRLTRVICLQSRAYVCPALARVWHKIGAPPSGTNGTQPPTRQKESTAKKNCYELLTRRAFYNEKWIRLQQNRLSPNKTPISSDFTNNRIPSLDRDNSVIIRPDAGKPGDNSGNGVIPAVQRGIPSKSHIIFICQRNSTPGRVASTKMRRST